MCRSEGGKSIGERKKPEDACIPGTVCYWANLLTKGIRIGVLATRDFIDSKLKQNFNSATRQLMTPSELCIVDMTQV